MLNTYAIISIEFIYKLFISSEFHFLRISTVKLFLI